MFSGGRTYRAEPEAAATKLHRRHSMNRLIASAAFALLASPSLAMDLGQVPAHVLQVAAYYAPDATWESAGTDFDTQLMAPEYEILGKMKDGTVVEVDVSPEGNMHEIETVIVAADVPAPVMKLVNAYLPGFAPTLVELSARPNNVNFYEFEGMVSGREVDVEVNAAGTEIIIADDAAI
jgi:hypothetical protein